MITDIISLVLVLAGSFFVLAAALGTIRFRDTMARVHAVAKPQTIGLVLVLLGAFIRVVGSPEFSVAQRSDLGLLVLLGIFALATAPVTAQRITRVARREGLYDRDENMSRNDRPAGKTMRRR